MTPPKRLYLAAWLSGLVYFLLACIVTPDFGPTWDNTSGSYPYGDEVITWWGSDVADFVEVADANAPPPFRKPYPDFYKHQFPWHDVYPTSATLSGISSFILWHWLGWVPPVAAHQIVTPLLAALMIVLLIVFLGRRLGLAPALVGVALMLASPRFFAHSIHNIKDMPECVFYVAAMCMVYVCLTERMLRHWLWLGLLVALALAQKANALFLPFQALVFLLGGLSLRPRPVAVRWLGVLLGALTFVVVYLAASPAFWHNTIERIGVHFGQIREISSTTEFDSVVQVTKPWMMTLSAPLNALITTPLPVLALAVIGVARGPAPRLLKWFLVLGALFPLCRLLLPGVRDFDGVRHFIEFYPWLCGLAGLGAWWLAQAVCRIGRARLPRVPGSVWPALVLIASLLPGLAAVVATYPYGTCYFNSLVGGLRGARELEVRDAADYWATSYWQAADWLNSHAPPDAAVFVPIAGNVVTATAPVRLRADLRLQPESIEQCPGELFVMYVTRRSFYGHLIKALERVDHPVHEVTVQGAVILRIYRFAGPQRARVFELIAEERRQQELKVAFLDWLNRSASNRSKARVAIRSALHASLEDGAAELSRGLPGVSEADAEMLIDWLLNMRR
ncbi:MAG: glycosyltransferase family 39 protein [Planctomycetota bacterium]